MKAATNEEPTAWHAEAFGYKCNAKPSTAGAKPSTAGATPSERLARLSVSDSAG